MVYIKCPGASRLESRISRGVVDTIAMKSASLLLVSCLMASGLAKPTPAVYLGYQDSLGQYSFGYSAPGSARSEVRTSNGATRGTYSYVDETGVIQTAQYVADGENGFRIVATNLPQAPLPVQDTPEVMAARTAHLQALEMATRREEAQSHEENLENALERKIQGGEANLDGSQQEQQQLQQAQVKSAENLLLEKSEQKAPSNNVEPKKDDSDESLQAVASRSGADNKSEDSQSVNKESAGRATTQEITGGANIPAIPSISSHVPLPQTPALGQHALPVFRISYGSHEIEPSAIPESSIAQGASGVITPAGTALRNEAISTKGAAATPEKKQIQRTNEQVETVNTLITPLNVIPLRSSYSSFIRYVSPVHYITYSFL